jgi:hypothetical protein
MVMLLILTNLFGTWGGVNRLHPPEVLQLQCGRRSPDLVCVCVESLLVSFLGTMDFVQRMKRALQRGRSATLPPGTLIDL